MKNKKVVLCIVAHPDDEALGPGGTLIKHSEKGDSVNVLILSEGEDSKSPNNILNKNRKKNAKEWAELNNCKLIKLCNFPDQRLDVIPQLDIVKEIERTVELIKPDIVYTHYPGDLNLDHQVVSQSTLTAIRPISYHNINPEIRAFETPSSSDQVPMVGKYIFSPNFYVSINEQWKKKIKRAESNTKSRAPGT